MRLNVRWLIFVLAFGGAVAAVPDQSEGQTAGAARVQEPRLRLTTPSFSDAGPIPLQFTCYADGGTAMSPPLQWDYVPEATRSFVLLLTGPENHRRRSHTVAFFWGRWNIPASARQLAGGQPFGLEQPDGSHHMESDDGIVGYDPRAHRRAQDRFITSSSCTHSTRCCHFPQMPLATPSSKRWMATSFAPACTTESWSTRQRSDGCLR